MELQDRMISLYYEDDNGIKTIVVESEFEGTLIKVEVLN